MLQVLDENNNLLDETTSEILFGFAPTAPLNLTEVTKDRTALAISLTWVAPTDLGGIDDVEYVLEAKYQKSDKLFARVEGINSTGFNLTGLIVDNSYTFSVFAKNVIGLSVRS